MSEYEARGTEDWRRFFGLPEWAGEHPASPLGRNVREWECKRRMSKEMSQKLMYRNGYAMKRNPMYGGNKVRPDAPRRWETTEEIKDIKESNDRWKVCELQSVEKSESLRNGIQVWRKLIKNPKRMGMR